MGSGVESLCEKVAAEVTRRGNELDFRRNPPPHVGGYVGKVDFLHTLLTNLAPPVTARLGQMSGNNKCDDKASK
jgi:hypothetical protein